MFCNLAKVTLIMYLLWIYSAFQLSYFLVQCQWLQWKGRMIANNSYISSTNITDGECALKCLTNYSNISQQWTWTDEKGVAFQQEDDGKTCLYATKGPGVISLNHRRNCTTPKLGLWRCNVPTLDGEIQNHFIFIGSENCSG